MKKLLFIPLISGFVFLQSCTIFSLHPLYHEKDLMMDSDLLGMWKDKEDGDEFVYFKKLEENMYLFRYMEGKDKDTAFVISDTVSFEAGLLKVGDHYFLDLYPYYEGQWDEADYLFRGFVPTHAFIKIEWDDAQVTLWMFNYDRMKTLFEQNRIRIKHEMMDDFIVITASTDDLQRFIQKYADDPEAFDEPGVFIKME